MCFILKKRLLAMLFGSFGKVLRSNLVQEMSLWLVA